MQGQAFLQDNDKVCCNSRVLLTCLIRPVCIPSGNRCIRLVRLPTMQEIAVKTPCSLVLFAALEHQNTSPVHHVRCGLHIGPTIWGINSGVSLRIVCMILHCMEELCMLGGGRRASHG